MKQKIHHLINSTYQYLNQPILGVAKREAVWHPIRFWYHYRINLLERCWQMAPAVKHQPTA